MINCCSNCGSIMPRYDDEECGMCGYLENEDYRLESKEEIIYCFRSEIDLDKNGNLAWKICRDEEHAMQMSKLNFKVRKVVKNVSARK